MTEQADGMNSIDDVAVPSSGGGERLLFYGRPRFYLLVSIISFVAHFFSMGIGRGVLALGLFATSLLLALAGFGIGVVKWKRLTNGERLNTILSFLLILTIAGILFPAL